MLSGSWRGCSAFLIQEPHRSTLGPDNVVVTSDLGQPGNVTHAEGFRQALSALTEAGFTEVEIDPMTKRNPARFLGLQ